jgi:Fe-S cluster assembly protein SufD
MVSDTQTAITPADVGVFTRDQVEMLTARKLETEWLREQRMGAYAVFGDTPMPTTRLEDWRYTDIKKLLKLDAFSFAEERSPVADAAALPAGVRAQMDEGGEASARMVQVDASVVLRELPEELAAQGVIFTSLETAAREHPELVQKHFGTAVTPDDGKFAALSAAFWTGGAFLYVPRDVQVEVPFRVYRWISEGGTTALGRLLVIAERGARVAVVEELGSDDLGKTALSVGAAEIFADDSAVVIYTQVQRYGRGVVHLATDRLVAGRTCSAAWWRREATWTCWGCTSPTESSTSTTRRCRTTSPRTPAATCCSRAR